MSALGYPTRDYPVNRRLRSDARHTAPRPVFQRALDLRAEVQVGTLTPRCFSNACLARPPQNGVAFKNRRVLRLQIRCNEHDRVHERATDSCLRVMRKALVDPQPPFDLWLARCRLTMYNGHSRRRATPRSRSCRPDCSRAYPFSVCLSPGSAYDDVLLLTRGATGCIPLVRACQPLWPFGNDEVYQQFTYLTHAELAWHLTPHGGWQCQPAPSPG
jgi:hypothetical protein